MRVFISQPMRGKTEEEILQQREEIKEAFDGEGATFIDSVISDDTPKDINDALWKLGRSLQLLAGADLMVLAPGWKDARGCRIEYRAAEDYGIQIATYKESLPDEDEDELMDESLLDRIDDEEENEDGEEDGKPEGSIGSSEADS